MKATQAARAEREELADLFAEVGPDAPTLCEGWTTRDLAAHLVVRQSRPDAAIGIIAKPFAGYTDSVQDGVAKKPWPELVAAVRSGPPLYSPFRIPGVQGLADLFEFVIHHEDVRRAEPGWQPRELPAGEQDLLWSRLARAGKMFTRNSPVGIALRRSDNDETAVLKAGSPTVTLVGQPLELLLRLYGRKEVVLDIEGSEAAVKQFEGTAFGV